MRHWLLFSALVLLDVSARANVIDRMARAEIVSERVQIRGRGFVTDATHPKRPGDFDRIDVSFTFIVDPEAGDAIVELVTGDGKAARYFVRRGRPFQMNDAKEEVAADDYGDLSPATIAALNANLVSGVIASRRENVQVSPRKQSELLFSWNDHLWLAALSPDTALLRKLQRKTYHPVFGDRLEEVRYEEWRSAGPASMPHRIVVSSAAREIANLEITSVAPASRIEMPSEMTHREGPLLVNEDISFRQLAPNLFSIDLAPANSRVFVAEFSDYVAVIEGAFNPRNGDLLARRITGKFQKPIRYFAFSHLHGQYVATTRSFVQKGATVLVPPSTAPLIHDIVAARHDLRPDALARDPKKLHVETIEKKHLLADDTNTLEIYSVESDHTDEYLIFHFPRQKVLLTGDLLFYRGADQPLRGRSRKLCSTVAELGLDVDALYVSWPLEGYNGVRNSVKGDEFRAACGAMPDK